MRFSVSGAGEAQIPLDQSYAYPLYVPSQVGAVIRPLGKLPFESANMFFQPGAQDPFSQMPMNTSPLGVNPDPVP
jgi:hypothetical protein